jgi:succinate dehydrogenase / fumarate reductase, cytochrome b subunit
LVNDRQGVVATTGQGLRRTRLSLRETWDSTIGKKVAVASSGAILVAYLILHMVGNLNSLYGAGDGDARVDNYAHWLRTFGQPLLPYATMLWAVRVILLTALIVHVTGVVQLTKRNRAARPQNARRIGRSLSARTMMVTGTLLLAFIIFHILQFTTLTIDVTPVKEGAVYSNLYFAFQKWYFVVIYVLAVAAVAFHLRHALWSMTQTLGYDRPSRNVAIRTTATVVAVVLFAGFAVIPLAFVTGVLGHP